MAPEPRSAVATAVRGGLAGACAFVLGYLVTYAWKAPAVTDAVRGLNLLAELFGTDAVPVWKAVGWLFYGAHAVSTRIPTPGGPTMVNLVGRGDVTDAIFLLPPLLLVLAGAAAARHGSADEGPADGAVRGSAIVAGYLPLAVVGAFATAFALGGTGRLMAPDLLTAVLLAGVVYPLAFGGLGGALATRL